MKRFKDILCVVDTEKVGKSALERAVSLAENNQANLTVIVVAPVVIAGIGMPEGGPISAELQAATVNSDTQELEALVEPYRQRIKVETKVLVGTPFLEVIREVVRNGRDLVIKMAEQYDWWDRWFGSDDMHLLRKCPCPVWLIKPQAPKVYQRILTAVDVDDAYPPQEMGSRQALNRQILEMAASLALSEFADLHIGCAWDAIGESAMRHGAFMKRPEEEVNAYVEQVRQHYAANLDALMRELATYVGQDALDYLKPRRHLIKGGPSKEIPALAKQIEADLVVMGTVARTGVPGFFMGNTAEAILNQIDCSVLAIKPPGFTTPVTLEV
jgi:nucleotide-binding universal stress UspA family protein